MAQNMVYEIELHNSTIPNILVVEDEPPDRALIEMQIRTLWPDCDISAAKSLYAAYQTFKTKNFSAVVLDLNLPDAMGPRTVAEMRRFNRLTPIIVLTGFLTPVTAQEALRLGANNIYSKSKLLDPSFLKILEQNIAG